MKWPPRLISNRSRGMTLVEVTIAIALAAMLSAGMYASAIYTMRQTAKNLEHIYAVQLASSEAAAVRAARFDKLRVDPDTLGNGDFEKRFAQTQSVTMNPVDPHSPTYTAEYEFAGFGTGITPASGGSNSWYFHIPEHSADWEVDQFKGHMVVITGGAGANQVMYILGHEETKTQSGMRRSRATLTSDLTGTHSGSSYGWPGINPNINSRYAIDYGMYCNVKVSWGDGAGYKTVTETVYVPSSR